MENRRNHRANGQRKGRRPGSKDSAPRKRRTRAEILAEKEGLAVEEAAKIVVAEKEYAKADREAILNQKYENPDLVAPPSNKVFDREAAPEMQSSLIQRVLSMGKQASYLGDVCKLVSAVCNFNFHNRSEEFEELIAWMRGLDLLGGDYHFGEDADFTSEVALLNTAASTEVRRLKFISNYDMSAREEGIFKPIDISLLPPLHQVTP